MSGGYRKYLQNIIPRMMSNHVVEAVLCLWESLESTHVVYRAVDEAGP